ncbi:DM13 domain-containing protein [Streptomyces coeruleorubidus]|uniref:DM13 domain-containing protein n=1 Tax=Streptomyces coeruleorubidus TaxID=116188 RepID=UPI003663B80A
MGHGGGVSVRQGSALRVAFHGSPAQDTGGRRIDQPRARHLGQCEARTASRRLPQGRQNYAVRADVDPSRYTSVRIWCDRFDVSFGAAELART